MASDEAWTAKDLQELEQADGREQIWKSELDKLLGQIRKTCAKAR